MSIGNIFVIIVTLLALCALFLAVFCPPNNGRVTDYELYGDIDPHIWGKCQVSEEYERGYISARKEITENKKDPKKLFNEAREDLDRNDFYSGWKDACEEYIN